MSYLFAGLIGFALAKVPNTVWAKLYESVKGLFPKKADK